MSVAGQTDKFNSWQGDLAYRLWVQEHATARAVCRACGISGPTLYRWRVAEGWDEQRQRKSRGFADVVGALRATLSRLAADMQALQGQPPKKRESAAAQSRRLAGMGRVSRAMHQLVITMDKMLSVQANHSPPVYALKIGEDLMDFVKTHEPAALAVLRPLFRRYMQERILGRPEPD